MHQALQRFWTALKEPSPHPATWRYGGLAVILALVYWDISFKLHLYPEHFINGTRADLRWVYPEITRNDLNHYALVTMMLLNHLAFIFSWRSMRIRLTLRVTALASAVLGLCFVFTAPSPGGSLHRTPSASTLQSMGFPAHWMLFTYGGCVLVLFALAIGVLLRTRVERSLSAEQKELVKETTALTFSWIGAGVLVSSVLFILGIWPVSAYRWQLMELAMVVSFLFALGGNVAGFRQMALLGLPRAYLRNTLIGAVCMWLALAVLLGEGVYTISRANALLSRATALLSRTTP